MSFFAPGRKSCSHHEQNPLLGITKLGAVTLLFDYELVVVAVESNSKSSKYLSQYGVFTQCIVYCYNSVMIDTYDLV